MSKTRVEKWFKGGEVSISSKTRSEDRSRLRRDGTADTRRNADVKLQDYGDDLFV